MTRHVRVLTVIRIAAGTLTLASLAVMFLFAIVGSLTLATSVSAVTYPLLAVSTILTLFDRQPHAHSAHGSSHGGAAINR